ncbi:MAG: DUF1553 domain-containing protein, partial [Planctomycetaceae bacterium]|nr:DUF1553 domain-containing protein [Planctomycetaceae bacterium]
QLFAFFNHTPVTGGGGDPQTAPVISWLPVEQSQELEDLQKRLTLSQKHVEQLKQELSGRQSAWERAVRDQMDRNRAAGNVAGHWLPLKATTAEAESQQLERLPDLSILATGPNPPTDVYTVRYPLHQGRVTGLLLEALRHKSMTKEGLARSDSGNFVLTELECTLIRNGTSTRLKLLEPKATYEQGSLTVNNVLDGNPSTGWAVYEGRPIDRDHAAVFRFDPPLEISDTAEIQVVLKHESKHVSHNLGRFRISATDDSSPSLPDASHEFHVAIQRPDNERTTEQRQLVTDRFLSEQPDYTTALQKQQALKRRREELQKNAPRVMVMADQPNRRPTFMLNRGLYNDVSDIEVNASTPASLSPEFSGTATANRLDLATWLVSDDQPLVARVTVNRIWQTFFGIGLVKTTEDFGVQSEYPPHKDLLDWLAADFRESGWDVKRLVQTIVTSHTYRQSSVNRISEKTDVSGEHLTLVDVDPDNRLLARGSRFRLPSWMLRDQALAVSGLLDDRQGGPPVNTYQPEGIWEEATFGKKTYARDSGAALYRRSLYIFWRRIIAPTMFFDVASRQTCTVRPSRTNTPLHALLTLNETAYVEAARVLAESLLVGGTVELKANAAESTERSKPTDSREIQDQLDQAFQRILCRLPTEAERRLFDKAISRSMTSYRRNPPLAEELLTVGDSARNTSLAPAEHAAWTNACLMLLNTDEALNHE